MWLFTEHEALIHEIKLLKTENTNLLQKLNIKNKQIKEQEKQLKQEDLLKQEEKQLKQEEKVHDQQNKQQLINVDMEKKMNKSIKKLVNHLLENDNINNTYIPDFIERKLYENVFTLLIGVLKDTLENANIKFLNQNIGFKITPEE